MEVGHLSDQPFGLDDVKAAERRIKGFATKTPVMTSHRMDAKAERNLFFKCELFQRTGSFKFRGAFNKLAKLSETLGNDPKPCVTTQSTGNFAQGVAYAASLLGYKACVIMIDRASKCKQEAAKEYGADVILCSPTEEGCVADKDVGQVMKEKRALYVSSGRDYDVMAGQGTICTELMQQTDNKLDAIVVPVGGGGMLSGILIAAKTINPNIKVYGAEPELADDCYRSVKQNAHVRQDHYPTTIADGLRGPLSDVAWPIVRDLVDDVITVSEDEIRASTKQIWECMKLCIEPSAGVGVAAVMSNKFKALSPDSKNVGVILCGGNIDLSTINNWLM